MNRVFSKLAMNDVNKAKVLDASTNSLIDLLTMIEADDGAEDYYADILHGVIDTLAKLGLIIRQEE